MGARADLADLSFRVVGEQAWDGPMAMALDEIAAETAADGGPATIRCYRWDPGTLSLGYGQDPATVDWEYCEREGITVTRRPTGGGGIYHDTYGDLSYSIVVPADAVPGDLMTTYELLCEPVLAAFERMGVDADFAGEERPAVHRPACYLRAVDPAHDVVGPDGRKVSGNAQYRQRDAVVQHGSLTFSTDAERHCSCFATPLDPGTFHERVGAIDEYAAIDRDGAVATLRKTLAGWADAEAGSWTDDELERARTRADAKFASDAWTRERTAPADE